MKILGSEITPYKTYLNRVAFKGSKAAGLGYVNDTLMRRVWDEAFSLYGLIAEKVELPEDRSSITCLLYTSPSPRDGDESRMPASA